MVPQSPEYPVRVDVQYPQNPSRLLIFVRGILAIPHYLALIVLGIGAAFVYIASWWVVLFTGKYPEGMFNYMVGVMRWGLRFSAYVMLLTDVYPPFSLDDDPNYPVRLEVDYPTTIARWRPLVNWLLVWPASIGAGLLFLFAYLCTIIAWFTILFTGRYPEGLFKYVVVAYRWQERVNVFQAWMTEAYPPLVLA